MDTRYEWRVEYLTYYELEDRLNELSRDGFEVVKIQFIPGMPEKSVPGLQGKQRRADEWIVILRRKFEGEASGADDQPDLPDLMELGESDVVSETPPEPTDEELDEA